MLQQLRQQVTDVRQLDDQLEEAKKSFLLAWHHFEQAEPEPDIIDAAIHRLIAAEKTYSILFMQRRVAVAQAYNAFRPGQVLN